MFSCYKSALFAVPLKLDAPIFFDRELKYLTEAAEEVDGLPVALTYVVIARLKNEKPGTLLLFASPSLVVDC